MVYCLTQSRRGTERIKVATASLPLGNEGVHENPVSPVNPAHPVNPVKKSPVATFDYDVTGQLASATRGSAVKYGAPGPLGQEYRKMVISIIDFTYRVVVVGKPTGPNATSQTYELYMNIGSLTLSDTMTKYE